MLTHKVDGEHHASYSNLLLAVWKLDRWAEVRGPFLPKTAMTGGSHVTPTQASGNLFPSMKLKENCTFTAQYAVVENIKTEGDSTAEPEEEEEVESSEGEA